MEHRAKSDESVTSRQSFNYAQDKQAADSRQPFGFKDITKLSFRSNGESKMRKLIIAMLLVLIVSFAAFAGETVRVYDNKCQLKYIYDVEKGRVYDTRCQLQYIVEDNPVCTTINISPSTFMMLRRDEFTATATTCSTRSRVTVCMI